MNTQIKTNNLQFQIKEFSLFLKEEAKQQNTIFAYITDLLLFFSWLNNNYTCQNQLTREIILNYKQYLSSIDNKAETINHKLSALKKYNEYLIQANQYQSMIIIPRDFIKIQKQLISPTDITNKDVMKFLDKIKQKESIRNYTIIYLITYTGLRISEALNIQLKDINLNSGELIVTQGKGGKQREIYLTSKVINVLKEYLAIRSEITKYALTSKYLFVSNKGDKLQRQTINKIFNDYSKTITPHKLRHYFCTNALEKGFGIHEVACMAGHSDINTTKRYLNPNKQSMRNKMELL